MDKFIQRHITQLGIISKVSNNNALDVYGKTIKIYKGGVFAWVKRRIIYQETRKNTLEFLNEFYTDVVTISDHMISTGVFDISLIKCLYEALDNSIEGLNNLCDHYEHDKSFATSIGTIKDAIIIPQLKKIKIHMEVKKD